MAEILQIRRKTLSNQSLTNGIYKVNCIQKEASIALDYENVLSTNIGNVLKNRLSY